MRACRSHLLASIVAAALLAACASTLDVEMRPCPCADGWVCETTTQRCIEVGDNLLTNSGFEEGVNPWVLGWFPEQAGALTTEDAARTGELGLYAYTAHTSESSFTEVSQQVAIDPATSYVGYVWARRADAWPDGTYLSLRIKFLSAAHAHLAAHEAVFRPASAAWQQVSYAPPAAPSSAAKAELQITLIKPPSAPGQAIVHFDDVHFAPRLPH